MHELGGYPVEIDLALPSVTLPRPRAALDEMHDAIMRYAESPDAPAGATGVSDASAAVACRRLAPRMRPPRRPRPSAAAFPARRRHQSRTHRCCSRPPAAMFCYLPRCSTGPASHLHGGLPDLHARLAGQHRRQRRPRHDGPARAMARGRGGAARHALAAGRWPPARRARQLSLTAYEPAWLRPPQAWQDARRDTGGAVRHAPRWSGRRRAQAMPRCGDDARAWPVRHRPLPASGRRGAARLASADGRPPRAPSPARPPNPPRKPAHALPKMPSSRPPILANPAAALAGPAVEPAAPLVAGPGPPRDRPDATSTPAAPSSPARPGPTARRALRAAGQRRRRRGAARQRHRSQPRIHLGRTHRPGAIVQSAHPHRLERGAQRRAGHRHGQERLPAAAGRHRHDGWRHSNGSSNIGLGDSSSNSSTHGTVGVLAAMAAVRLRRPAGACRPPNRRPSPATSP